MRRREDFHGPTCGHKCIVARDMFVHRFRQLAKPATSVQFVQVFGHVLRWSEKVEGRLEPRVRETKKRSVCVSVFESASRLDEHATTRILNVVGVVLGCSF